MMKKMPDKKVLPDWKINNAYDLASNLLEDEYGFLEESPHDYQCFIFNSSDVKIIFYPHRTSARNYHIRVRDGGSKNKQRADEIMNMLDEGAGFNCTFSRKAH